jgi:Helix-turn-helix domain
MATVSGQPILDVTMRGFTAWLLAPVLRREMPRLLELAAERRLPAETLAEARRTLVAVQVLAEQWYAWRIAEDGSTETVSAEAGASSASDLTTSDVASLIGRSERRVRQLLDAKVLVGVRRGGQWWVDPTSVAVYLEARRGAA